MRVRRVLPWLVLPSLVVVAAACLVVARTTSMEREHAARLTAAGLRASALLDAQQLVEYEVAELTALDAFIAPPPAFVEIMEDSDEFEDFEDRDVTLSHLVDTEAFAGSAAHELRAVMPLPPPVGRVLAPLEPRERDHLRAGATGFLPPTAYVDAMRWLDAQLADAEPQAEAAELRLREFTQAPPYWQSAEFAALAAGLALFALLGAVPPAWRVVTGTRRLGRLRTDAERTAARMEARVEQMRTLIELGRRLSTDAEPGVIASTIVHEARRVLAPELCALAVVRDGRLVPTAVEGVAGAASISFRDGAVGRAAETGMTVRTVVPEEPMFVGVDGPLSLLATPLTYDGRVAAVLVVGRRGSTVFEPADEALIDLVAMMSAGALRVAERYGSTLALALDDPLTGLGNRRRLDRDLDDAGPERGGPVSFLMIDIDRFKLFNDRYGHPAGDALLRDVGAAISTAVRSDDVAYRFGGEEFSVLLPDADARTALQIAERIRRAVAAITPPAGSERVTVSVGVSVGTPQMTSAQLVDQADRALYDAKRSGRDRVTLAGAT